MVYKGAIFDMDGVLFDTERLYQETWKEIADERDIKLAPNFLLEITGTSGQRMIEVVNLHYQTEKGTEVIADCMSRMKKKLSEHVPVKSGVHEVLEFFKENGIRMAVASSSPKEQIEANLVNGGIRRYFSEIVSGTEVEHGKPAPDVFLKAAKRIDCKPEECYVFEDSKNGVKAGHAAGCATIMIPDLIPATAELEPLCLKICTDFYQVIEDVLKKASVGK